MRVATSSQVISSLEVTSKSRHPRSHPRPCNADMMFVWSQPRRCGLDVDTYIQGIFGVRQASTGLCLGRDLDLAGSPSFTLHCHHHMSLGRSLFLFSAAAGIRPGTAWIQNVTLEEPASAATHPKCPTSSGGDPVLGLARTVKGPAGCNVV